MGQFLFELLEKSEHFLERDTNGIVLHTFYKNIHLEKLGVNKYRNDIGYVTPSYSLEQYSYYQTH